MFFPRPHRQKITRVPGGHPPGTRSQIPPLSNKATDPVAAPSSVQATATRRDPDRSDSRKPYARGGTAFLSFCVRNFGADCTLLSRECKVKSSQCKVQNLQTDRLRGILHFSVFTSHFALHFVVAAMPRQAQRRCVELPRNVSSRAARSRSHSTIRSMRVARDPLTRIASPGSSQQSSTALAVSMSGAAAIR